METIYTIDGSKLNKPEIDILHFIDSWLPTFTRWSVLELGEKCNLFASEATASVDMLVLHGLLDNAGTDSLMGRMVSVSDASIEWMRENNETINSLYIMNDCELFTEDETATA